MKNKHTSVFILLVSFLTLFSCKKEEEIKIDDNFTVEDIETIEESSQLNLQGDFEGFYKGKINGKEVELELKEEYKFELKEGGKSFKGDWDKIEDGTKIELISEANTPRVKYYAWSDNQSWIALNDSLEYPENEEFLTKEK